MTFRLGNTVRANYIFFNLLFSIIFLISQKNIITILLFMLWMNMIIFAYNKLNERIVLFMFSVSFFVFLLGREFLEVFLSYKPEVFSDEIFIHTNKVLILSLATIFTSYFTFEGFIFSKDGFTKKDDDLFILSLRDITGKSFYLIVILAIIYTFIEVYFVLNNGYYAYYIHFKKRLSENILLFFLSKAELFLNVSVCCFFATFPSKKEVNKLTLAYCFYIFMGLFTGARSSFVLGILFLVVYYIYRNALDPTQGFITKKKIFTAICMIPFIFLGLGIIDYVRAGDNISIDNFLRIIPDFIYDQGVSINVIKRAYQYKYLLNNDRVYSFFFLHTGIFSFIFSRGFIGNTIINGVNGYQFTHALSYILLGDSYLSGRGIGTSYIAELFHDFGINGIIIGNIILSYVLCATRKFSQGNILLRIIKLLIIQSILWMPRGNMGEIISLLFSPFTIASIFVFICLAKINVKKYKTILVEIE